MEEYTLGVKLPHINENVGLKWGMSGDKVGFGIADTTTYTRPYYHPQPRIPAVQIRGTQMWPLEVWAVGGGRPGTVHTAAPPSLSFE